MHPKQRYFPLNRIAPFFLFMFLAACTSSTHQADYILEPKVEAAGVTITRGSQFEGDLRHFVEFRAEMNVFPGHSYLVHGQVNGQGEIIEQSGPFGFYPRLGPIAGITIGWIAAPGTIDPDPSDVLGLPKERYLVFLTPDQHARLADYIAGWRGQTVAWNLLLQNCNDFATGAAQSIGLSTPSGLGFTLPHIHIRRMRELNGT
jgi:hypothetical protein